MSRGHHPRRRLRRINQLRTRVLATIVALPVIGLATFVITPLLAGAVDATGQFAMDGTIQEPGAPTTTPPFHWADLFDGSGNALVTHASYPALLSSEFVPDYATPDTSYFGSNKDTQGVGKWSCTTSNTPTPKDDIQNAYMAVFSIPKTAPENAGDIVAYMGIERHSNKGDSFAGFWLFKDPGVSCAGNSKFSGHHTDGDLLILTNFTNGGGTADVTVFRWTGNDTTGHPVDVTLANGGGICGAAAGSGNDSVCAISNSTAALDAPWSPWSNTTQLPSSTFTEAAIDLTKLFGGTASGPCFSNFMAETRSSQQITATLKDYAASLVNTCVKPTVGSTASGNGKSNLPGSTQTDDATVSGGAGNPTPTGRLQFSLCTPSQVTSAGCPSGAGTNVGAPMSLVGGAATSPPVNGGTTPDDLSAGTYCWGAQYLPDANSNNTYVQAYGTNNSSECFVIGLASPVTGTTSAIATGSSTLSSNPTLSDTATLTGMATDPGGSGAPVGETVAFSLWGPYANGVTPTCAPGASEPVFTTTGTLAGGGSTYSASTSATYSVTAVGTYVWTTAYAGDAWNQPSTEGCNGAGESQTITTPNVSLTKTADNATVSAGSSIGFTVTVSNSSAAGTGTATDVVVNDPLPGGSGVSWSISPAYTGPGSCSITGAAPSQTLGCTISSLAAGASASVHVTSATQFASCALYSNTASATVGNQPGTLQQTASTTVQCPSLGITKTADAAVVSTGTPIGFTVAIANGGPGSATGVTVNDPLPAGTGVVWAIDTQTSSLCSITGTAPTQVLSCALGTMVSGASYTVHITSPTTLSSGGTYPNTASVSATNAPTASGSASTQVDPPALSMTKTADSTTVGAGQAIGFTVTVSNNSAAGTGTASGVTVNDPLPSGTDVSWSISPAYSGPGTCSITGSAPSQTLTCSLGSLAPGASASVHVSSATSASTCSALNNTATVSATNAASLTASASITMVCGAVLGITTPQTGAGLSVPMAALVLGGCGLFLLLGGLAMSRRRETR